jgi:hypothetical protein
LLPRFKIFRELCASDCGWGNGIEEKPKPFYRREREVKREERREKRESFSSSCSPDFYLGELCG